MTYLFKLLCICLGIITYLAIIESICIRMANTTIGLLYFLYIYLRNTIIIKTIPMIIFK